MYLYLCKHVTHFVISMPITPALLC